MEKHTLLLVSLAMVSTNFFHASARDICELVSTFDAVCKLHDNVIILSAHPCKTSTSLSVTVIDFSNGTQTAYTELDGDTQNPISMWGTPQKGIALVQTVKPGGDDADAVKYYRKSRLHVRLYLVDINFRGVIVQEPFLDVLFPMLNSDCSLRKFMPKTLSSDFCRGHSLGNYSTFCVITKGSAAKSTEASQIQPGVYILLASTTL